MDQYFIFLDVINNWIYIYRLKPSSKFVLRQNVLKESVPLSKIKAHRRERLSCRSTECTVLCFGVRHWIGHSLGNSVGACHCVCISKGALSIILLQYIWNTPDVNRCVGPNIIFRNIFLLQSYEPWNTLIIKHKILIK